jgi:catechol 2,3-dioxygenase-like lactoylglutathione lyase family enzyme
MQQISVISVPVSDQPAAKPMYTEQLGMELVAEAEFGDELRWIQVGPEDVQTSLTLVTWFDEMPPGSLRGLVIDCADLEAEYRLLTERDVRFLGPPASQPGGTFATLVDPDGNHVSLRQTGSAANV